MLKSLYIKNYALFEECQISFPGGLNILTGETGAGKSLLVGALGLIMGKRADSSAVFFPDTKCVVEAGFGDFSRSLQKKLESYEEFDFDDPDLIIRREISPSGKSRAFINDTPASLQLVREISNMLVDLHGQHENQSLLMPDQQMAVLDAFVGNQKLLGKFGKKLSGLKEIQSEIRKLESREKEARDKQDFLDFQIQELQEANLQAEEEEALEQELNLLQNSEEIRDALAFACETLYNREELSVHQQVSEVVGQLEKFSDVGEEYKRQVEQLIESRELLKETSFALQNMLDSVDSDPARLSFIEERLAIYHNLKLKYKLRSGAELVKLYEDLVEQSDDFASLEGRIAELKGLEAEKKEKVLSIGLELENSREHGRKALEKQINSLLKEVGFKEASLMMNIERTYQENGELELEGKKLRASQNGINKVTFLIRTNPGLPVGPLSQIASGGEISRVMLAIKSALADRLEFPVLIFDEIDTGISGEIANKVGRVMQQLADRFQIISITHLPQIASKGHDHFMIHKEIKKGRTISSVKKLGLDERIYQLARMISGDDPSESAIKNALEMIG